MAAANAAVNPGSLVKELAICSANLLRNSGDSASGPLGGSGFGRIGSCGRVRSSMTVGLDEWNETERGFKFDPLLLFS